MFEAGLYPDILANNTHLVAEGLMLYNVIDRRRLQLEDIKSGTLHIPPFSISFFFGGGGRGKLFAYAGKQLLSWCICQSCYLSAWLLLNQMDYGLEIKKFRKFMCQGKKCHKAIKLG